MAIGTAAGGHGAIMHAPYAKRDFFEYDLRAGTIRERTGTRGVHVTEDFMVGLQNGLEEEVGDAAAIIMYRAGREWALQDMKLFEKRFEAEYGGRTRMNEANVMLALETWWWPLTSEGWGTWKVDFSQSGKGLVFVDLFDSAVAKSLGNIGKPVCHMYAGLLAGVFTYFSRHELSGIEIQCYAMGEEYCKFLIGAENKVNAAGFWVQEGASAREIMERAGE